MPHAAILVPGIMGSVLKLDGDTIWPGSPASLMLPFTNMEKLLREDLVATDCIRRFFFKNLYDLLIDDLATCGFDENDKTLIIAAYDWRKNNLDSAAVLGAHIEKAIELHGADVEISIIGHSMGGLIARCYLESNHFTNRTGFKNVRRLITLGTPHHGAALALPLILGHEKRLFLNRDQVLRLSNDMRYPTAYQLLPPPGDPFAWDGYAGKQYKPLDIYDSAVAERLGLIKSNLQAAEQFHESMNINNIPSHVRYFCFAGTQQMTATHVLIRPTGSGRAVPIKIEQRNGGDGTVPTWSGFLANEQRMFVGGEHSTIYSNNDLRRSLATVIGKEGLLRGVPQNVDVALREKVVEPRDHVHLSISLGSAISDFSGVLTIEKASIDRDSGNVEHFGKPISLHTVDYRGIGVENLTLVFTAPEIRGVYRVAFRDDVQAEPSGYDELIVQQTATP